MQEAAAISLYEEPERTGKRNPINHWGAATKGIHPLAYEDYASNGRSDKPLTTIRLTRFQGIRWIWNRPVSFLRAK